MSSVFLKKYKVFLSFYKEMYLNSPHCFKDNIAKTHTKKNKQHPTRTLLREIPLGVASYPLVAVKK